MTHLLEFNYDRQNRTEHRISCQIINKLPIMQDTKFKIYFYFCAVAFFLMLTIILYYSFGYKYNMENGTTIQTGIIVIKTSPKDVIIYRNDKRIKNGRSITNFFSNVIKIENLDKGKYNIKVQKDGYHNWEKNIIVKAGLATSFDNVILLKENYTKKILLDESRSKFILDLFWVNDQQDKIIYSKGTSLNLFDTKNSTEVVISDFANSTQTDINIKNVIWSTDGTKFISKIIIANKSTWYLVDLENKNELNSLNNIFGESKEKRNESNISFDKFLYYTNENNLYKFDYKTLSFDKILDNVSSFLVQNDHIYYFFKSDNRLYSASINDLSIIKTISTMPDDFNDLLDAKITRTNERTFTILSSSGNLYFINENNEVIYLNSFVEKSEFSDDDKKIVYNNKHEIWVYNIDQSNTQTSEKEFVNNLITRFSGTIKNVYLYQDNKHLLYQEGNTIKFLELDNRDSRNVFELMNLDGDNIFYAKDSNSLFYTNKNKLVKINLSEE